MKDGKYSEILAHPLSTQACEEREKQFKIFAKKKYGDDIKIIDPPALMVVFDRIERYLELYELPPHKEL